MVYARNIHNCKNKLEKSRYGDRTIPGWLVLYTTVDEYTHTHTHTGAEEGKRRYNSSVQSDEKIRKTRLRKFTNLGHQEYTKTWKETKKRTSAEEISRSSASHNNV